MSRAFILVGLAIVGSLGAFDGGVSIVDDRFSDGNSRNQNLSANSLRLFNGRTGTVRNDVPGRASFDLRNAGGSDAVWAFFSDSGAPVRLGVGDKLSVSVTFLLSGFPATAQDIRFGVFDSLGTRNSTDLTGGMNQASFVDDPGYGLQYFPSGTGSAFSIGRRANLTGGNIFNSFGDFAAIVLGATANPERQTLAEDTPYTLKYVVDRIDEGETRITVTVDGGGVGLSYSVLDSGTGLPSAFDYFAFRVNGPAFAQGLAFSRIAVDYLPAPPRISLQPQPSQLTVQVGSQVTLTASASGSGLRFQWNQDGRAIDAGLNSTALSPTLLLNRVAMADAGRYTLVVRNGGGFVESNAVTLRVSQTAVAPPPQIRSQPRPVTVSIGEAALLTVEVAGEALGFQWFRDGVVVAGANAASLQIEAAQLRDAGLYTVLVSNPSGTILSEAARLSVVSRMSVLSTYPATGSGGVCFDPPFSVTFSSQPVVGRRGQIRLLRADGSVADAIDMRVETPQRLLGSSNTPFSYYSVLIEGNTAWLFFPRSRLAAGESYSIAFDEGSFLDASGNPFRGRVGQEWNFSVRTNGPSLGDTSLVVDANGGGDFCTVQSAIDFIPANNTQRSVVSVRSGEYREFVYVAAGKNFVTVRSDDRNTTIRYPNNANLNPAQRQVFGVDAADFTLENITIRNTTPKGGSQAEAVRGNNNRILLNYVNLYSYQDTLWLQGTGMVNSSYIEGDVDFMWGNGSVFFRDSELRMLSSGGYYTQIRNTRERPGNVYLNCRLTAEAGVSGAYLSRIDPGVYPFSQVIFLNTQMGPHIRPEGWLLNNASSAPSVQFWEYNSRDEKGEALDVSRRAPFSRQLTAGEAERWSQPGNVLQGWSPSFRLSAGIELSGLSRSFTGSPQAINVVTVPANLAVRIRYAGSAEPPSAVGTYPVSVEITDPSYQGSAAGSLVIRPSAVAITLSNLTQTFDGLPKPVGVTTNPPTEGVTVTYNGAETVPVQPGRYAVVASFISPNFRGRSTATLAIRPAGGDALAAFPGAEGEGAGARGGRGGDVYHVTNLNDSGEGSLRMGISSATGPRTIVFDIAGTIQLRSRLSINKSFLTIAGQTAPGDGITIAGWPTVIQGASHIIVRYLRFRLGDSNCPMVQDDALWVDRSTDVIIDHVSASWSVDETLSVTDASRVTVQWSFISESLRNSCHDKGAHGYGSLIRFGDGLVSYHHNLFAHHDSRNPRIGDNISLDFVNNVIYNWGGTASYSGANEEGNTRVNWMANTYLPGPSTSSRSRAFTGGGTNTLIFQENNLLNGDDSDWGMFAGVFTRREATRFDLAQVELGSAADSFAQVLEQGGASLRRDAVDRRVVEEVLSRRGKLIDSQREVGSWPVLLTGTVALDTDRDGMPDAWEMERGLNARDASDGARTATPGAYTNLELYLNSLAAKRP